MPRDRVKLFEAPRTSVLINVGDLSEYDVLWSGNVIVRVDVCPNDEYREITMRRNDANGVGTVDTRTWHKDERVAVLD